jgi:hypothetical protein
MRMGETDFKFRFTAERWQLLILFLLFTKASAVAAKDNMSTATLAIIADGEDFDRWK